MYNLQDFLSFSSFEFEFNFQSKLKIEWFADGRRNRYLLKLQIWTFLRKHLLYKLQQLLFLQMWTFIKWFFILTEKQIKVFFLNLINLRSELYNPRGLLQPRNKVSCVWFDFKENKLKKSFFCFFQETKMSDSSPS